MALSPRSALLAPLLAAALVAPVSAEGTPRSRLTPAEEAGRTIDLTVYGSDPCPTSDDGTIVVCARKPESERYRIPKELRKKTEEEARVPEQGWGSRAMATEDASRTVLPNSCSAIGSNGYTGCTMAMLRQWYAERRAAGQLRSITP